MTAVAVCLIIGLINLLLWAVLFLHFKSKYSSEKILADIADELNKYISPKPCSIGMVTGKSLPESIFCRDSIKYIDNIDVSNNDIDELANDEFDRLLDEFIEKNLSKQDTPSD